MPGALGAIASVFGEYGIEIANVKMVPNESASDTIDKPTMQISFMLKNLNEENLIRALERTATLDVVLWNGNQPGIVSENGQDKPGFVVRKSATCLILLAIHPCTR
ncbi:hypothetical protein MUG84_07180 [Paenibacillus sp. KQZ6P-2]|uniref:ACT domain-containing protein n=1 Tax=Paenibacillus mangrovi TaxID=2931978 RepID=A0A9X1WN34_9BACL|nr:hypothetical protein [Paenibacillus mangrovi]MCJ8011531.1 hypothetical protein [Paenibacillus mangrovi]